MTTKKKAAAAEPVAPPAPTRKPGIRIIAMRAENIKRLKVVQIRPKGHMVQITGENESGKSSVLDAIEWALCGTANLPSQPIRKGETAAKIEIDLDEYKLTRFFNKQGTKLQIEGRNREQFRSPQALLDGLMGKFSFDPLEFLRMKPKQQLETLRGLVKVDADLDGLDAANKVDYDTRRDTNRDVDQLKARLSALPASPIELPAHPVKIEELTAKMQNASAHNSSIETAKREADEIERGAKVRQQNAANARSRAENLRREAQEMDELATKEERQAEESLIASQQVRAAINAPIDTAGVAEEIARANTINALIEKRRQREAIESEITRKTEEAAALTKAMEERQAAKVEAIRSAEMPVEGLGFGDGEVLYQELPFDQASNAAQIRVSVAMAMASNPTIRILRIKDGSLLDEKSLALVAEMAEEHDYQVWIERVDSGGKVGVVMVDGEASGEEAE